MANRKITKKIRDEIMKKLVQNFGPGYDKKGLAEVQLKAFPTGYGDLDCLLTKGSMGIARGALVEILGSAGSGKTSVAMRTVGHAQKAGHLCCWLDAEAAFSHDLAHINGVNTEELVMPELYETKAMENQDEGSFFNSAEILHMIYRSVVANCYGIIVLDSVAGLMAESVLDVNSDPNKKRPGEVAISMSKNLGKIAQACKKTETTVIFINQLRDKIGEMYPDRFHTPGGRSLDFFSHQRISVEKIKSKAAQVWVKEEDGTDSLYGHYARTAIVKNRMAPPVDPDVQIQIPIYYKKYNPDNAKQSYDLARKLQVINIRGSTLTWKDGKSIVLKEEGESNMLVAIRGGLLESRLAAQCVIVANEEKNLSKKSPVRVGSYVASLAGTYDPNKKIEGLETLGTGPLDLE
ncbi:hypothetical protein LCGC14_0834600 [marine sediment metagenome]|uniref:RecA family profile 2 domain-containing protein n=1 Tax=marine sediment metagenome TaxID=412755 RepID=A0A0F9Q084_9ZZZZ